MNINMGDPKGVVADGYSIFQMNIFLRSLCMAFMIPFPKAFTSSPNHSIKTVRNNH